MARILFSEVKLLSDHEEVAFAIKIDTPDSGLFIHPRDFSVSHIIEFLAWNENRYKALEGSSIYKKGFQVILKMDLGSVTAKYRLSEEMSKQFCEKLSQLTLDAKAG